MGASVHGVSNCSASETVCPDREDATCRKRNVAPVKNADPYRREVPQDDSRVGEPVYLARTASHGKRAGLGQLGVGRVS